MKCEEVFDEREVKLVVYKSSDNDGLKDNIPDGLMDYCNGIVDRMSDKDKSSFLMDQSKENLYRIMNRNKRK